MSTSTPCGHRHFVSVFNKADDTVEPNQVGEFTTCEEADACVAAIQRHPANSGGVLGIDHQWVPTLRAV